MKEVDYLIVGQGIAGTMLSYFLLRRNKKIHVVDDIPRWSSSKIAAGLFNPITGQRMVKTWRVEELFPFAEKIYQTLEGELNVAFYHKINILRLFSTPEERELWDVKAGSHDFSDFIWTKTDSQRLSCISNPCGAIEITHSGYVNMDVLIEEFKKKILRNNISENTFRYQDLSFNNNKVIWNGMQFKKIIFCEGYKAIHNPYFSWLPFVPAKGEVITIHSEDMHLDKIVSKGIFILPLGSNKFKVGSTYTWNDLGTTVTEDGKSKICNELDKILNCKYAVVEHQAGIRPTVKDRKPMLGLHPQMPLLGVFNGLGTKGASLAPFFANEFVEFIEEGKALDNEVDIRRFWNNPS